MSKGKVVRLDGDTCMYLDLLSSKLKEKAPDYLKQSITDNLVIKVSFFDTKDIFRIKLFIF